MGEHSQLGTGGRVKAVQWWADLERRVALSSFTDEGFALGSVARSTPEWQMWAVHAMAARLELDGLDPIRLVDIDDLTADPNRPPPIAGIRVRLDGIIVDLGVRVEVDGRMYASIDNNHDLR